MDGTLTVAAHDFDAIRAELGLPPNKPILEEIARRPQHEIDELFRRLEGIEQEIAKRSRPQPGARDMLASLRSTGARVGIVTRNGEAIARVTLAVSGLAEFFSEMDIVGRESSAPKPRPDGVIELLRRWEATPERAVMIGDHGSDLEAGRSAGTATVYFDADGDREWEDLADYRVERLAALLDLCAST